MKRISGDLQVAKMKKALKITLGVFLILGLVSGLCLALIEPVKAGIRKSFSAAAVSAAEDAIKNGNGELKFAVPVTDALSVNGENGGKDAGLEKLMKDMRDLSSEYESLTLLGILEIPGIKVKEPIWDSCSVNALRYGVGRYPGTADIGSGGLCNIFGHRMSGDKDTKLGSIQYLQDKIGDDVIVTTIDGVRHRYRIADTLYVTDAELMPYLDPMTFADETLCITACGYGEDPLTGECYPDNTEFIVMCKPY